MPAWFSTGLPAKLLPVGITGIHPGTHWATLSNFLPIFEIPNDPGLAWRDDVERSMFDVQNIASEISNRP
jgi:hypothetical protein